MEAYKEFFRHARNEEKRQEMINCFQQVWTSCNIFGRVRGLDIKWKLTPPKEFLPEDLGAWTATPIRIHRLFPSPDSEADFAARPDFNRLVEEFLQAAANRQPLHPGDPNYERSPSPAQEAGLPEAQEQVADQIPNVGTLPLPGEQDSYNQAQATSALGPESIRNRPPAIPPLLSEDTHTP